MASWKRAFDLTCCLAAMPVLAVLTVLIAAYLGVVSPGPVFYWQERVGRRGRKFRLYKFRTMKPHVGSEAHKAHLQRLIESGAPMVKLDAARDSRLVPGAWLLRAAGLDEVPQLVNVLRGEMSLVGPRPCIPYEYEQYQPWQRERLKATPGLTGLWQVSGKNRTSFEEMVRLDIAYAESVSPWLDVKIIVMTPVALLIQVADARRTQRPAGARKAPAFRLIRFGRP